MEYTIRANEQFNSNEIYFEGKPSTAIREALKALKMRWNPKKACWYGFAELEAIKEAIGESESELVIPETIATGEGLYSGWTGGNAKTWGYDSKVLKQFLQQDFKKAGIKATFRFPNCGCLTSLYTTITINHSHIKTYDEYRDDFQMRCGTWYSITDENGRKQSLFSDRYFEAEGEEQEALRANIIQTEYELDIERLAKGHTYGGHGALDILNEAGNKIYTTAQLIVQSYNSDHSNSMIDYFDRDIYDNYCFKLA